MELRTLSLAFMLLLAYLVYQPEYALKPKWIHLPQQRESGQGLLDASSPSPAAKGPSPPAPQAGSGASPDLGDPPVLCGKMALPPTDKLVHALDGPLPHYKTCALVGSSHVLRGSNLGPKIDAHEAVFRLNMSPSKGFERDVGNRTTIRFHNSHVCNYKDAWENAKKLAIVEAQHNARTGTAFVEGCFPKDFKAPSIGVAFRVDARFLNAVMEEFVSKYPTNGVRAIYGAMHLCDHLYLYGLGSPVDRTFELRAKLRKEPWPNRYFGKGGRWDGHPYLEEGVFVPALALCHRDRLTVAA